MAKRKDKGQLALEAANFTVHQTHKANRWYDVTDPTGKRGAVLRQYDNAWHFFWKDGAATASGSNPGNCHKGGLGDAIDDDKAMKRYCELLDESNVPEELRKYDGVYVAMQQAYAEGK